MKKYIVFAVFSCLIFSSASAQVTVKPGLKGGANFSTLTGFNADFSTNFYVGGFAAIKLAEIYTLQPELLYSAQGAIVKQRFDNIASDPANAYSETKYSLDYLSMSVINKFTFGHGFEAVVGPTLDFQVSDNLGRASDDLIGFDMGIVGGVGYSLPNGLTFEARFKQGFIDIFGGEYYVDSNTDTYGDIDDVYLNQVFQVGLAYTFDVKQK
ncbi:hypothetical protein FEDK69T_11870 [Flavobacterium enshiense DK69]|uniref:Outer membrane protein beta-barrel domain-containing protein n=1 Tax=Flavobacterium enshiense DK69 TaxID=1107311 RepID=V6SBF4_9FLAO|nr:porin family protein [Flavobacterium enshiense]ESU23779.1 hypothetical protein FEDK69T_11870 [Flavobacterium enshiense DK69]KGO96093.1 hypothetical protein Q767_07475 [Flavobacterium enshiense DK69]